MAERKPTRLEEHRPVRRAPDDYDAPTEEEDAAEDAEYDDVALDAASADTQPDVLLDVPVLKVEEIHLEVENLKAQVSLQAEVLNLLKLHVGADVSLGHVTLEIKGVDAVAQLKVRLDKVEAIIDRVMTTIDNNPQILTEITRGLGEGASEVGRGAGQALKEVGAGAESAVESVGGGVEKSVGDLGQAGARAVEDVVEDTGGIAGDVLHHGGRAGDSGRETGQAERRPADRAAGSGQARRIRRPRPE